MSGISCSTIKVNRIYNLEKVLKVLDRVFGHKSVEYKSVLHQPDGVGSQGGHLGFFGKLNGVAESPEVEITAEVQPVNINEEEEESTEDDYELKRRDKGKHVEESRKGLIMEREKSQTDVAKMITDAIQQERKNLRSEISSQINDAISNHIPLQFERLHVATTPYRPSDVRPRDQDDPYDDAYPEGENSQRGRRRLSMELLCLENHLLVKTLKVNKVHQRQIVARRENGSIVSITELDYKKLNKNDIEDMYLLIVHKVDDYAETGLLWSLSVFIRSIEKFKVFSIFSEPVYGIIYKNNKKEKRVMRHQEVHKFCDATLKRVLEGLKSYNNDVKHGYVSQSLSNEDAE
ncbi:hypothetical protein Tco_0975275 [Tanacetum coccineum]|uniref:Uncharacterized protein n=1 Tax=Tanacetum coccineum TaxID=301880 RepID=A0ABQ5EE86_9ASTR